MLISRALIASLTALVVTSLPVGTASADWGDVGVEGQGNGVFTGSASKGDQRPARPPSKRSTSTSSPASSSSTPCSPGDPGSGECFPYFKLLNPGLTSAGAESIARSLVVRLQLPDPTPQFGPDPADNEWNMAAVGYPLWLWTNGPRTVTSTTSESGMSFTLRARYRFTTFTLGDGHIPHVIPKAGYFSTFPVVPCHGNPGPDTHPVADGIIFPMPHQYLAVHP